MDQQKQKHQHQQQRQQEQRHAGLLWALYTVCFAHCMVGSGEMSRSICIICKCVVPTTTKGEHEHQILSRMMDLTPLSDTTYTSHTHHTHTHTLPYQCIWYIYPLSILLPLSSVISGPILE